MTTSRQSQHITTIINKLNRSDSPLQPTEVITSASAPAALTTTQQRPHGQKWPVIPIPTLTTDGNQHDNTTHRCMNKHKRLSITFSQNLCKLLHSRQTRSNVIWILQPHRHINFLEITPMYMLS